MEQTCTVYHDLSVNNIIIIVGWDLGDQVIFNV